MEVGVLFHIMVFKVNDLNISIFNSKAWRLSFKKYDIWQIWPHADPPLTHQVVHGSPALGRDVAPGEVFPLPPLRLLHRQRQHRHRGPSGRGTLARVRARAGVKILGMSVTWQNLYLWHDKIYIFGEWSWTPVLTGASGLPGPRLPCWPPGSFSPPGPRPSLLLALGLTQ